MSWVPIAALLILLAMCTGIVVVIAKNNRRPK